MNGTELVLDADGDTGIIADTDDRIDFKIAGSDRGNLHYDGNDFFSLESNDYLTLVQNQTAERGLILGPTYFKPYNAHDNTLDLGIGAARWKDLYLSGGAYLGGTGAANYLDDYETGTFTPVLGGSSVAGTQTGTNLGYYTKVGDLCYAEIRIQNITLSGASGAIKISGLPFACDSLASYSGGIPSMTYKFAFTTDRTQGMYVTANQTYLLGMESRNGDTWQLWSVTNNSALYMNLSFVYKT